MPKPKPKQPTVPDKVLYPELESMFCIEGDAITLEQAKQLLGWETEKQLTERLMKEQGLEDGEVAKIDQSPLLKDENRENIYCYYNCRNRPFDEGHCRKLAQDILNRNWAGPLTMPGETINGETIVISRTGKVISGQHRLVALVLAGQLWAGKKQGHHWQEKWSTEPVLETLIVRGVSDSAQVLRTIDNVKPRTLSDVLYTSEYFVDLSNSQRKEYSRMFARAVDLLWKRTGAGETDTNSFNHYQSHSESLGFIERHPKLLKCLRHLFDCNEDRSISNLKLSPGQCSALLYLMGSSASDGDIYRNSSPRSEKKLDWENWDRAQQFWVDVSEDSPIFKVIRRALGMLVDEDTGADGRTVEKFAILAKAWGHYLKNEEFGDKDLELRYRTDELGAKHLDEWPELGGIDLGDKRVTAAASKDSEESADPTPEEIAAAKDEKRRKIAEMAAAKVKKAEMAKAVPPRSNGEEKRPDLAANPKGKAGPRKPPAPKLIKPVKA